MNSMEWAATVGSELSGERYITLRHEDVVTRPEQTIRDLCRFFALEYDAGLFDFSRFKDQSGNPWRANTAFGDIPDKIVPTSVGRWQDKLQSYEIVFVESILGHLFPIYGYEPSGQKIGVSDACQLWDRIHTTPLIRHRFSHWLETGEGTDTYPSDPTDPANWHEAANRESRDLEPGLTSQE